MQKVKPMLAKLVDQAFDRKGWFFEIKWDGYRAIAEVKNGKVLLYSRSGKEFKEYQPVIDALAKIKFDAVFDGEIIALEHGRPSFHALQNYAEKKVPIQYVIFDLLSFRGQDLRKEPLSRRKAILKKNFPKSRILIYSEHVEDSGRKFFERMKREKFEGMIAKDGQSSYLEGARSSSWLKVKNFNAQEAIIIGYTQPRGSRKYLGALVLGAYKDGELKYVGHSGGGFTQTDLKKLAQTLSKLKISKSPVRDRVPVNSPITWVKPQMVCQIHFSEWTPSGRMRHPIYVGERTDKKAQDVVIENPARETPRSKDSSKPSFSNLDKVFWPQEKYTKGDVIDYYRKIAPVILPYLLDRPESLNRHPNGIKGINFFQKDVRSKVPDFVLTQDIWSESNKANIRYLICQNEETLLYLANLGCIELNPWNSRLASLENPDYMIIDLDPGKKNFKDLVKVALETKKLLDQSCEESFVKTSGKRGLHIFIPLGAQYDYDTVRMFSEILVRILNKRLPELTSIERNPKKRGGRIYLDYLQNRRGQTLAAPYSLRPWPGATVSTPLEWKEVKSSLDPSKFNIKTIFMRLKQKGDLWKKLLKSKVDLNRAIHCLEDLEK